jgi:hypothetical protein
MDGRCNNEGVEIIQIQTGSKHCAIMQRYLMPLSASMFCRPFGDFSRLAFGRSINNQDVQDIPPFRKGSSR